MKRSVIWENGAANFPYSASCYASYISSPRRDKGGYRDMIRQKVEDICPDWQVYQKAAWNLSQLNLPQVVLTLGKLLLGAIAKQCAQTGRPT